MGNAIRNPKLLLVVLTLTAAALADLAAAGDPRISGPELSTEVVPAQTEYFPGEISNFCPRPLWYGSVEGVALKRDAAGDQTFAMLVTREWNQNPDSMQWVPTDTAQPVLGTSDLGFDFSGGGRALLGRRIGECYSIEVGYLGVNSWSETAAVRDNTLFVESVDGAGNPVTTFTGSLFSPFTDFGNPAVFELDYNNFVSITYFSELHGLEWNLRRLLAIPHPCFRGSLLVGGRWMAIRERFNYYSEAEGGGLLPTNDITVTTNNDMVGVQVGASFQFQVEPAWWIETEIKGVAFSNVADQSTQWIHTDSVNFTKFGGTEDTVSTWALDLRLTLNWQVNQWLSGRIGYQALWVDGLALASENLRRDSLILPATAEPRVNPDPVLVSSGKAVYHGPSLGITCQW